MKKNILIIILSCFSHSFGIAQVAVRIGAQVIIEPGQSPEQIESWFRLLNNNGMTVCRIRLFEDFMRKNDVWDFSLFDVAFKAAEKYNIDIFATLFPSSIDMSIGGFKFPESDDHLKQIENYIEKTVSHFKSFDSLYGWVLLNEPGTGGHIPQTEFSKKHFEEWRAGNIAFYDGFLNPMFLMDYNTWYLGWLARKIANYDDKKRDIHVNNHQIFDNVAEYDFPAWRNFLTSLGASAHPSWHYTIFDRSQYAMALSANCEIIRSGAGNLPFWITELQGGNNTYSGINAFCPTADEITQWLWLSIGSGAKGVIFWSLNSRSAGEEAGEWALLDFLNQPTDRLDAASNVIKTVSSDIFNNATTLYSPIHILYVRESLWTEKQVQYSNKSDLRYEGRLPGGVIKSAISYFDILAENGIKSSIGEINEYDWNKTDYSNECIILANQINLPSCYQKLLVHFVRNGGKLIVDGLTSYYDENMRCLFSTGFPMRDLFGGELKEVICIPGDFKIPFNSGQIPSHLWKSYIRNDAGTVIAKENNQITAIRNIYGSGSVVWLPSLIGLGAYRTGNKTPLSDFLREELKDQIVKFPFIFTSQKQGVIMQTMKSNDVYITVLVNKNAKNHKIALTDNTLKPILLFSNKKKEISKKIINIAPEETMVIAWK